MPSRSVVRSASSPDADNVDVMAVRCAAIRWAAAVNWLKRESSETRVSLRSRGHVLPEPRLDNVMFSWCEATTVCRSERPMFEGVRRGLLAESTKEQC